MLCQSGMATMSELLDLNGVWTEELVATMLPVAVSLEADDTSRMFGATAAAVSLLGGPKGAHVFESGIAKVKAAAQESMRRARGLPPEAAKLKAGETAADQFIGVMAQMCIFPQRRRARPHPQATRKH